MPSGHLRSVIGWSTIAAHQLLSSARLEGACCICAGRSGRELCCCACSMNSALRPPRNRSVGPSLSAYPNVTIAGPGLRAVVYLPDAHRGYYRSSRYDWGSMAGRVELDPGLVASSEGSPHARRNGVRAAELIQWRLMASCGVLGECVYM